MRARRLRIQPAVTAFVVLLVVAACGSSTSSPASSPAATVSVVPPVSGSPTGFASPSILATPGSSPAVPVDPTLLAVLPDTVSGQQITEVPEVEAELITDSSLIQNAAGLAVALGINMTTGDFAYVAVIELKPFVFSNAFFASWRESYDQGACSQSSGLKGTSTAEIGGRQVFVGTCTGGALTYHVHLAAPDRLISITSVGTAKFGELVLAALAP